VFAQAVHDLHRAVRFTRYRPAVQVQAAAVGGGQSIHGAH
jgi:hypothetical protein